MGDDTGIAHLGGNRYAVRVTRVCARTGRVVNRKCTVTGTKATARAARDALRAELQSTAEQRPRKRLAEYSAEWLARRSANNMIASTTATRYRYALDHILPELGDLYLDSITRTDVEGYIARRVAAAGEAGGATVSVELRLLRTIARDAVAESYSARHWADRISTPRCRRYSEARPNRFTPDQARPVLALVPARWRGLVLLLATTGLRWGEATALYGEDLDRVRGQATIRRNNRRGVITAIGELKTASSYRTVPVLPEVLALLGPVRAGELVFPSRHRDGELGPYRGNPLVRVFRRVCAAADVPYTTPHGLRRTATNLGRGAAPVEVRKAMSGQTTDAMIEHYSHVELSEKRELARAIARQLGLEP